jgi:hypothetical protein
MFYCSEYLHSAITEVVCADVTRRKIESNIIKIAQNDKMEKQVKAYNISPSVSVYLGLGRTWASQYVITTVPFS